ncbi:sugar ABC transporter permease [Nocardia terpenica]|uniref:carbohydrate ABC transporter permease n=1 Tax=Nocardia terpenica TaxID=455432 RepID=UPI001894A3E0|nr:sugar ABC transporter permease [Nocardia terpenica]MBF6062926.1 sugar ABC transporter permease [Nocardia terpenica]MBF6104939.1 sugar ABC transporter permease [Nocardia terpenica]MBF6112624.1 sugar ABC transporter permease [Nocardia terpenica]MBF6118667.1 sugar ABC transporter permease [Nocardia terpenica]MBF6155146.1 sugar ABC transporter permease [Nocardia terpenica]
MSDPSGATQAASTAPHTRRARPWLFVAPVLLALAVVIGYPVVRAVWMSFQKDSGLNEATGMFEEGGPAGFGNYTHWLLQQCQLPGGGVESCPTGNLGSQFWAAVAVTLLFTVVTVTLEATIGLGMAMVMGKTFRGRALLRAAVLIPWAIPTAVTARLWEFMFQYDGVVNRVLHTHLLWQTDPMWSRVAVITADVWKTTPFMALLILAGLQVIPGEVYEAARVDGASAWQRFTQITLPLLKPALLVAVLFRTMDALRLYDLPAIMTQGNPATRTISILVVDQVRQGANSASALSVLTFFMIFAVAFVLVKVLGANAVATQEEQRKAH